MAITLAAKLTAAAKFLIVLSRHPATVRDALPPDGPDVLLEVYGVSSAVPVGVRMLRIGGRYVLAGPINPDRGSSLTTTT